MAPAHLQEKGFVPGTVHLVDLEGTLRAKHASGTSQKDIVLVPAPSSDPNDPLNWTPRLKLVHTIAIQVYTLMIGIASAAIYSVLVPISDATNLTLADLNAGTGYMFLAFGGLSLFGTTDVSITDMRDRMGMSNHAASRPPVRKETYLSLLTSGHHWHHDLGSIHQEQWPMDCEQSAPRSRRSSH